MKLLAVETATEACSVALYHDGSINELYDVAPRAHGRLVLKMAEELLAEAGLKPAALDAVAFGRGPGAFTGVRIAVGVVQGIAFAADIPAVPVSTLAVLAQDVMDERMASHVLAVMDARMGEVYTGAYQRDPDGWARPMDDERVCPADKLELPSGEGWTGAGSGFAAYGDVLRHRFGTRLDSVQPERLPRARAVARLGALGYREGHAVPAEQALPVYLRDDVIQTRPR